MKSLHEDADEPMMNIICSFSEGAWKVIVSPRQKFRPDAYYREDDAQIMVSPGAVEMGGFIVTPRRIDFDRLNLEMIDRIYEEVCLGWEHFNKMLEDVSRW